MSDLIKRDSVIDSLLLEFPQINIPLVQIALERISAVDAVEVVRCKDCIYNENGCCTRSENYDDSTYRPDYFCADGERRDENAVD